MREYCCASTRFVLALRRHVKQHILVFVCMIYWPIDCVMVNVIIYSRIEHRLHGCSNLL